MNPAELSAWPKALLLKIHVITGWVIPSTDLLNILVDQFGKKLVEDYSDLNTDEIEYAFRKSGTTIQDWGKGMNLNLLDQVLIPYVGERLRASAVEEKVKSNPQQVIMSDEQITNKRRAELEVAYQAMRMGKYPLIYDYYAELLVEDGFIQDPVEMTDFFVNCLGNDVKNLYTNE